MAIRKAETLTVTVRESSLLEAVIIALESGEFRQIRRQMYDGKDGRCVLGVAQTVGFRAGLGVHCAEDWEALLPTVVSHRAAAALGYTGLARANDAGVSFAQIAQALRQAREELMAESSADS